MALTPAQQLQKAVEAAQALKANVQKASDTVAASKEKLAQIQASANMLK